MLVMVVGATGTIGIRLVPRLLEAGHEVIGTSRSAARAERLSALGAHPLVLDALDAAATRNAVAAARPDAVVFQPTALAGARMGRSLDRPFAATNRLRTEGVDNLLAAAREARVRRFVAQSFAPYRYAREGGWVKTEDDRLDAAPPKSARETFAAMTHLDRAVTEAGGIALRYGGFYGPGDEGMAGPVRRRQNPLVGRGDGVMSFVHLDDAATATVLALDHEGPGVYNVVDDEPAPMRDWLPVLADAVGAKRPFHVPSWLVGAIAGGGIVMMTESRGCSNAKAKRELGWSLRYPSWREGFAAAYGRRTPRDGDHATAVGRNDHVSRDSRDPTGSTPFGAGPPYRPTPNGH